MWQATDTMDAQNYLIKDLEKFFQLLAKTHNTSVSKEHTIFSAKMTDCMLSKWKKRVRDLVTDKRRQRQNSQDTPSAMFPMGDSNPWKIKGNATTWGFCFLPHFLKDLGVIRNVDKQQN